MIPLSTSTSARWFGALFLSLLFAAAARADDELLVYVFSEGAPVEGATVSVGEAVLGQTSRDGSLFADLSGNGLRAITVSSPEGTVTSRFSAAVGQLVDVVARLDDSSILVDVYSQSESVADRRAVAEGTLNIIVEQSGEPVADESIYIAGSGLSLVTDASGLATVTLPRGRYRMQVAEQSANFRVVGGLTRSVSVVIDEEGEAMQIAAPEIEEVFVVASFDPSGLEVSERDASNIVDTIGVELLTRFSDSDVAASVVRVPGISVQDDKYVFIRGLGGRYISSTLNGATMPSTNPSKRTVPLDLFPSNFVSQLDIKKTFLPFMPGESTGGNLVINTKTFPDERTTSLSVQVGYLDGVTGETVFIDPIDGDFDFVGWDDGSRKEDISVKAVAAVLGMGRITDSNSGISYELDARTKGELQRLAGILIKDGFDPDFESALPEGKLGASYGDLFYLDSAELGVYTAVNYSNEWSQRDSGERYTYESEGEVADNFLYERYSNNVEISALASVGLNIGNSTFEWNNVVSRVTESWVERVVGQEGDEFQALMGQTIQWEERTFASTQLVGSHFLNDDGSLFLEWQATGSFAYRYAPDRRDFIFTATQSATDPDALKAGYDFSKANNEQTDLFNGFILEPGEITRRYDDLTDANVDLSFDLTWDVFDNGASYGQLKGGAQLIYRERDADSATYGYNVNQIRDDLVQSDNLLVSDVVYVCGTGPGTVSCPDTGTGTPPEGGITNSPSTGLVFVDKTLASDSYEAELDYNSVYLMYDHTWNSMLQFVVGARYEMFDQTTETFSLQGEQEAVEAQIDENSVLPSFGVNWYYAESQQLRLAVSQTVARPDFKEAANATFYDNEFNFRVRGNPFLEISEVINADLRWEWYPSDVTNLSVAAFYKDMDKPIERVVQPASGTAGNSRTFQNSDSAELYGVEIDGRTEFLLSDDYSQTIFVSVNAAFIESEVTSEEQEDRALQGQPEYTANLIIGYDNIGRGHQLTLLLNQNGKSIADVGVSGQPDVFLEPRLDLNLVYRYNISDSLVLRAKVQNLLDEEYEYTQGGNVFQTYERGIGVQVAFDWNF